MFALLEILPVEKRRLSKKLRDRLAGRAGVTVRPESLLGASVLRVSLDCPSKENPKTTERRIEAAILALKSHRIRRVCFSEEFPYKDRFLRESFAEADESELLRPLCGKIAARLSGDGEKTAAIYFTRGTELSDRVLRELAVYYRRLIAGSEKGVGAVCRRLLEEEGVSVLESRNFSGADVAVFLDTPRCRMALPERCVAVCPDKKTFRQLDCGLYVSDVKVNLPDGVLQSLPAGFSEKTLLSLLMDGPLHGGEELTVDHAQVSQVPCELFLQESQGA